MYTTGEIINHMLRHRVPGRNVIDLPADDPIMLQAQADGYADRGDHCWIGRGNIQSGERRIVRFTDGDTREIIG